MPELGSSMARLSPDSHNNWSAFSKELPGAEMFVQIAFHGCRLGVYLVSTDHKQGLEVGQWP